MAGGTRVGGRAPPSHWIIANGFWSDSGLWFDQSAWATRTAVEDQVLAADVRADLNYALNLTTGATISNLEGGASVRTKINALLAATTGATAIANRENEVTVLAKIDAAVAFVQVSNLFIELTIAEGDTDAVTFASSLVGATWSVVDDDGTGATIHPTTGVLSIPAQTYYIDARLLPNNPDSFYNIPVGSGAVYEGVSEPQTVSARDELLEDDGFTKQAYTYIGSYPAPFYTCDGTEDTIRVYYTSRVDDQVVTESGGVLDAFPWDDRDGIGENHGGDFLNQYFDLPLPNGDGWRENPHEFVPAPDYNLILFHEDGKHYWEIIYLLPTSHAEAQAVAAYPLGHWYCFFASYQRLDNAGWTTWALDTPGHAGSRAPGFPALPGLVRADEIDNLDIPHGLAMLASTHQEKWAPTGSFLEKPDQISWPVPYPDAASHYQWVGGNPAYPVAADSWLRQGDFFAIPASVNLYELGISSPVIMALAKAYQNFGGYVVDTTIGTFSLATHEYTDYDWAADPVNSSYIGDMALLRNQLCWVSNGITRTWPGSDGTQNGFTGWPYGGDITSEFGGPGTRIAPTPRVAPFGNRNPARISVRATQGASTEDGTLTLTVTEIDTVAPQPRTDTTWSWVERHPLSIRLHADKAFVPTIVGGAQQADFAITSWSDAYTGKTEYRLHWAADATKVIDGSDTYAVSVRYTNTAGLAYTDQTITVTVDQASATGNCITEGEFSTADLSRWRTTGTVAVASDKLTLTVGPGHDDNPLAERVVYLVPGHTYRLRIAERTKTDNGGYWGDSLVYIKPRNLVANFAYTALDTTFTATTIEHILYLQLSNWSLPGVANTITFDGISLVDTTANPIQEPDDLLGANLKAWYSAADITTLFSDAGTTQITDGGNVYQWNDKSGNGRHLTQATLANRPAYDATGIDAIRPGVTFTAANADSMTAALGGLTSQVTIYVVVLVNSASANSGRIVAIGQVGVSDWDRLTAATLTRGAVSEVVSTYFNSGEGTQAAITYATKTVVGGIVGASTQYVRVDGTEATPVAVSTPNFSTVNAMRIGTTIESALSAFDGTIAEIIICAGESADDRSDIELYLNDAWGM
jgi:hypothetical protein